MIILNEPSVLTELKHHTLMGINYFFNNNPSLDINKYLHIINHVKNVGGRPGRTLVHLTYNRLRIYMSSLMCGVKEKDADWFASSRTELPEHLLLTFKALYPVVGYFYAKYFILECPYYLDKLPSLIEVASKLNSQNILNIKKCIIFCQTETDLYKIMSLRIRKRKFE